VTARSLANLILGTLIVAAAALLLFSRSERQTYRQTVSDMNTDIVDRLVVERDDGSELIFNNNKDNWFLIEPVRLRARPARIEAMLALPNTISRERLSATEANLRIMHLSPPLLKLRIGDRIFHFGGIDPIKNRRYVRHGKTIHLIDDRLFHQLTQPIAFFAHIQLLPIDAAITQITYPDHTASLDGGRWQNSPGPLLHGMDTAALVENWDVFSSNLVGLGPALILLNVILLALGLATAKAIRLDRRDATTISIESGIQNGTLAIAVGSVIAMSTTETLPPTTVPAAVYSITMYFVSLPFVFWRRRLEGTKEAA